MSSHTFVRRLFNQRKAAFRRWCTQRIIRGVIAGSVAAANVFGCGDFFGHSPKARWFNSFAASTTAAAGEIGFVEEFALAQDRSVPLKQLIPGTEEFYYYQCLHLQNLEQLDKVDEVVQTWTQRHGLTPRLKLILNRQALLTYDRNPNKALEYLRLELGLSYNHQREQFDEPQSLPVVLDPKQISRATLIDRWLSNTVGMHYENSAIEFLADMKLEPVQRRELLKRVSRPDVPNLVSLLVADMNQAPRTNLTEYPVHTQLLLQQLDELAQKKPELKNELAFVNAYLTKLAPSDDVMARYDVAEQQAYLDRVWTFVQTLSPAHNSLKAHVLYYRLLHDRTQGKMDKDRFLAYLKLPRSSPYINAKFMEQPQNRAFPANLQADFSLQTGFAPIINDEPLVRSYLHHFLVDEPNYKAFEQYLSDEYLKRQFAETKIVNGLGDPEQWYALLSPAEYQALKERVDLEFAPTNKSRFAGNEPVSLDIFVKNAPTLIVKVFEINTRSYYQQTLQEINTDVNLDGLVPNLEQTAKYAEPPLRRVRRKFDFPMLNKPGVYVIDFIGNGQSSRALIRKGELTFIESLGPAGHEFTVYDEAKNLVPGASIWMTGREFKAEKDGQIVIPYGAQNSAQTIVLSNGDFSSLGSFVHRSEAYELKAAMYVERESLIARRSASVLVRPSLLINGEPTSLSGLSDVKLTITSTDLDGISTTKVIPDFKLHEDRESEFTFTTPERLNSISFTLAAKVTSATQNKKVDLQVASSYNVNEARKSAFIEDVYLSRVGGKYMLELLGRSGEPRSGRTINLEFKHRDFVEPVQVTLQTDDHGVAMLGELKDISSLIVKSPEGVARSWNLTRFPNYYPGTSLHAVVGDSITIPYEGVAKPKRDELALFEVRNNSPSRDRFDAIQVQRGLLTIQGLEPGDYDLVLKNGAPGGQSVRIRVTAGEKKSGYAFGGTRRLQLSTSNPLAVEKISTNDEFVEVQLANHTEFSRVHVFATRFLPEVAPESLGSIPRGSIGWTRNPPREASFVIGRNIGDEYQYILNRKFAQKFPGNMLERPGLLLNPWPARQTQTGEQKPQNGQAFNPSEAPAPAAAARDAGGAGGIVAAQGSNSIDFLAQTSAVMINLEPDEKGIVRIPRKALNGRPDVYVVAVDPTSTIVRSVTLNSPSTDRLDTRLANGLDPQKHFVKQKRVSVIQKDGQFVLPDISSSRYEIIDSIGKAYTLLRTLNQDSKLAEFEFLVRWPKLDDQHKRELYSKYACHELNFFLFKKDAPFFEKVVQPYLANKKHKTFLDHWLLGDELARFQKPWEFNRLNLAEQILFGRRVRGESELVSRNIRDQYVTLPPNPDRFILWFDTAMNREALDATLELSDFASLAAKDQPHDKQVEELERLSKQPRFGTMAGSGIAGMGGGGMGGGMPGGPRRSMAGRGGAEALSEAMPAKPEGVAADFESKLSVRMKAKSDDALGRKSGESRAFYRQSDLDRKALFTQLDKTQEWAENNYYLLPIDQQTPALVKLNGYWTEFAAHSADQPFRSGKIGEATGTFTEALLALAVLDLPFDASEHKVTFEGAKMTLTAAGPAIIFHEEVRSADESPEKTPILISESFFRPDDRYRILNNEQVDKFVSAEFVAQKPYGAQVVVTNPTSTRQRLDMLIQVPAGAIPMNGGKYTNGIPIVVEPFQTQRFEYFFYFPQSGDFDHYPVHVSKDQSLVASAPPTKFHVVDKPTQFDKESWDYVSQRGTNDEVVNYLKRENLHRVNLDRIAFRLSDRGFFEKVVEILRSRHIYNHTLWSYGLHHNVRDAAREFLQHSDPFVAQCGTYLRSSLLDIDSVERYSYEHLEYRPLVNARTHQLGRKRQIVNDRAFTQYDRFMNLLSFKRKLDDDDWMSVTYYHLLQDRVAEALDAFSHVNPNQVATRIQYDYLAAYLDMFSDTHESARGIADKYKDYPVDKWRNLFAAVRSQLDEIDGAKPSVIDPADRNQRQGQLAASQPTYSFELEGKQIALRYENLDRVTVNYYLMDVELLFSRNPFVRDFSTGFSFIRPNQSQVVELPKGKAATLISLPDTLQSNNVLVEVVANGKAQSRPYYSNALMTSVEENYGQLRVQKAENGLPISKAYVKVYAKLRDGRVEFYKDGYTDHRGRFDYVSLSTNMLDNVERFSVLVLTDEYGATVREAAPPAK